MVFTIFLRQKGSPESNPPEGPEPDPPASDDSPWPVKQGGWIFALYQYSLTLTLFLLFVISFGAHAWGGKIQYNEQQLQHGQQPVDFAGFLSTSEFWFQSMQNWQSEFMSIAMMVVLAIFLRQKGSPESNAVTTPHCKNE